MGEVERQGKKWLWFDWGTRFGVISNFEPRVKRHKGRNGRDLLEPCRYIVEHFFFGKKKRIRKFEKVFLSIFYQT